MTALPGEYVRPESRVTCKRCGKGDLAWAKSQRTGRYYLCPTAPSRDENKRDVRYAVPWAPHRCDPDAVARKAGAMAGVSA